MIGEGPTASCFGVGPFTFYFVLRLKVSYFSIFVAEDGFEVEFAQFGLVEEYFAASLDAGNLVSCGRCEGGSYQDLHLIQLHMQVLRMTGCFRVHDILHIVQQTIQPVVDVFSGLLL